MEKSKTSIGKSLPRGAKKKIAEKLNVSQVTVVNYFKNKQNISPDLERKILEESKPYLIAKKNLDRAKNKLLKLLGDE